MCSRRGGSARRLLLLPVLLAVAVASGAGCTRAVNAVAGIFGPGGAGETIDAHVVYRLRPDCPALVARTLDNGYTVLTPLRFLEEDAEIQEVPEFLGSRIEETGLFEGPVRTGEVVFRYVPPAESETWDAADANVVAEVDAVRLSLTDAHARIVALCGFPPPAADSLQTPRL